MLGQTTRTRPLTTSGSLPEFQQRLRKWFKRSRIDIWITEYAHQTRPQDRFGVSYRKQAEYIRQSISIARKQRFTKMFVWFVFRDDRGQGWESGIYTRAGSAKGNAPTAFTRAARGLDPR